MNIFDRINWSLVAGIFAGAIVIVAAFASWNDKRKETIKADKSQAALMNLQKENLNKTNELADAYKQIASLQKELRNEITGGDNKPILRLTTSSVIIDGNSREKYFILFFDILNNGDYSLQNVKATVYDNWGLPMLRLGVKHFRDGVSFGSMKPTSDEINHFTPVHHFDNIGTIAKNNNYPLYTTTFCAKLSNLDNPGYTVEAKWYTGSFTYFVNLKELNDAIKLDSVELVFNGKKIDYTEYFEFNK